MLLLGTVFSRDYRESVIPAQHYLQQVCMRVCVCVRDTSVPYCGLLICFHGLQNIVEVASCSG